MSRRAEGGRKGGTAEQKASRLRVKAERLARQADAWVSGIEREPAVARKLSELPSSYVVLSDVPIPETVVRTDHLVVGPGGLYLVDAKKYSGKLMYSKKMLWHGRFPITDKLDTIQWEADCLSAELGRSIVAVLCFVDAVLPQPVTTLGSVIVCRVSVLATVVRSTHTTISSIEMGRIIDTAASLGGSPVDYEQYESSDFDEVDTDDITGELARHAARETDDLDELMPPLDADARAQSFLVDTSMPMVGPQREPKARRGRRRVLLLAAGLVATAVAVGVVWGLSQWQEKEAKKAAAETTTTSAAPSTTAAPTTTSTTQPQPAEDAAFEASCPGPGAGWTMKPIWPGTFSGLVWYDYAVQDPDTGQWITIGLMTTPDPGPIELTGLEPGQYKIVRIIAAHDNGTGSEPRFVLVTAPSSEC